MFLKRRHEKGDFRARSFNAYLAAIEAFFDITIPHSDDELTDRKI